MSSITRVERTVFVDPDDDNCAFWWPALIVPPDEYDIFRETMDTDVKVDNPNEDTLVCYFEDSSFSVVPKTALVPFSPEHEPFLSYAQDNARFVNDAAVRLAIDFWRNGAIPMSFRWLRLIELGYCEKDLDDGGFGMMAAAPPVGSAMLPSHIITGGGKGATSGRRHSLAAGAGKETLTSLVEAEARALAGMKRAAANTSVTTTTTVSINATGMIASDASSAALAASLSLFSSAVAAADIHSSPASLAAAQASSALATASAKGGKKSAAAIATPTSSRKRANQGANAALGMANGNHPHGTKTPSKGTLIAASLVKSPGKKTPAKAAMAAALATSASGSKKKKNAAAMSTPIGSAINALASSAAMTSFAPVPFASLTAPSTGSAYSSAVGLSSNTAVMSVANAMPGSMVMADRDDIYSRGAKFASAPAAPAANDSNDAKGRRRASVVAKFAPSEAKFKVIGHLLPVPMLEQWRQQAAALSSASQSSLPSTAAATTAMSSAALAARTGSPLFALSAAVAATFASS